MKPSLNPLNSLCVFCGSSFGTQPAYTDTAKALGELLARNNITVVYGGGDVGLMGVIADATLAAGGKVIGVIPKALADLEVAHYGLTELHVVTSMHERKAKMAELSDAFIAMPGGLGTLEEFFEVSTWTQLRFHDKACGLLNIDGFYDGLLAFLNHATDQKFIRPEHRGNILSATTPEALLTQIQQFEVPSIDKWWNEGRD